MNRFRQLTQWTAKAPNAMNRQAPGQPRGHLPILCEATKYRQLVPARQSRFSPFEATTPYAVKDQTRASGAESARCQRRISSLQSTAIRYDHPQEPVGGGRQLTLQRPRAMSEIDDDRLVSRARIA